MSRPPVILTPPTCHCGGKGIIVRQVFRNGSKHACWVCRDCGTPWPNWVSQKDVIATIEYWSNKDPENPNIPHSLDDLDCIDDKSDDRLCEICGSTKGVEYHHYFPKSFWRQVNKYEHAAWDKQGAFLCAKHHYGWHQIVTPQLVPGAEKKMKI